MAQIVEEIVETTKNEEKRSRNRSPNHPLLGLQDAVEKAAQLHKSYGRHSIPVGSAHKLWNYTEHGGIGNQCVAALKAYGLLDVEGQGKSRKISLTDRADRIIRNAPDRGQQLKMAAVEPSIHRELLEEYKEKGLPPDDILRTYLVWERDGGRFNEDVVDAFIDRFRKTLEFAGVDIYSQNGSEELLDTANNGNGEDPRPEVRVGSYVQWTSRGVDQFPEPLKVAQIVDGPDGKKYAYVDGEYEGALPVDQLTVENPVEKESEVALPPNPFFKRRQPNVAGPRIEFPLPDDNSIEIQLKKPVSKKTFERILKLVELSEDSLVADGDDDGDN